MAYSIEIEELAQKAMRKLDKAILRKVKADIDALGIDPRPQGFKPLKGIDYYRIVSAKDYRIIYDIIDNDKIVIIALVGHRSKIYQQAQRRLG